MHTMEPKCCIFRPTSCLAAPLLFLLGFPPTRIGFDYHGPWPSKCTGGCAEVHIKIKCRMALITVKSTLGEREGKITVLRKSWPMTRSCTSSKSFGSYDTAAVVWKEAFKLQAAAKPKGQEFRKNPRHHHGWHLLRATGHQWRPTSVILLPSTAPSLLISPTASLLAKDTKLYLRMVGRGSAETLHLLSRDHC
ncbi:hypothetical protein HDK64DRAFT_58366 [Phyllosticta capitalensis]